MQTLSKLLHSEFLVRYSIFLSRLAIGPFTAAAKSKNPPTPPLSKGGYIGESISCGTDFESPPFLKGDFEGSLGEYGDPPYGLNESGEAG